MQYFFDHFLVILALLSFIVFLISIIKDIRRFRNAIFLFLTLFLALLSILTSTIPSSYQKIFMVVASLFFVFLFLLVPFMLIVNGFVIVKKEGFRFSNLLTFLFGILIFLGEFTFLYAFSNWYQHSVHDWLWWVCFLFGFGIFYTSNIFLAFLSYSFFLRIVPKKVDFDFVVVLGCGLLQGEYVGKLLGSRVDKAIEIYERSLSDCKIIVSGGQGSDEKVSEAFAMQQYLLRQGISERSILLESQSTNTKENLLFSEEIIKTHGGRKRIAIVSSEYHILRALVYAQSLKFPVTGYGSKTAFYYWPNAMVREFVALMKHYLFVYICGYLFFVGILLVFF